MSKEKTSEQRIAQVQAMAPPDNATPEEIDAFTLEQDKRKQGDGSVLQRKAKRSAYGDDEDVLHLQKLIDTDAEIDAIKRSEYYERCKKKLTTRQERFLDQLMRGNTMVGAYRAAYNVAPTRAHHSVFSDAWKLAQHPLIVLELRAAAMQKHASRVKSSHEIREYVIERLLTESQHAHQDASRIRALELLGKLAEVSMFVTKTEHKVIRDDPEELKRSLVSKLHEFFRVNSPALLTSDTVEEAAIIPDKQSTQSNSSALLRQSSSDVDADKDHDVT